MPHPQLNPSTVTFSNALYVNQSHSGHLMHVKNIEFHDVAYINRPFGTVSYDTEQFLAFTCVSISIYMAIDFTFILQSNVRDENKIFDLK